MIDRKLTHDRTEQKNYELIGRYKKAHIQRNVSIQTERLFLLMQYNRKQIQIN